MQVFATLAQSFLLVGLGMELSMPTVVIHALYPKSNNGFSLTLSDTSWYGTYIDLMDLVVQKVYVFPRITQLRITNLFLWVQEL